MYYEAFKTDIDALQYMEASFPDGIVEVYRYVSNVPYDELELIDKIQLRSTPKELFEDKEVDGSKEYLLTISWSN